MGRQLVMRRQNGVLGYSTDGNNTQRQSAMASDVLENTLPNHVRNLGPWGGLSVRVVLPRWMVAALDQSNDVLRLGYAVSTAEDGVQF